MSLSEYAVSGAGCQSCRSARCESGGSAGYGMGMRLGFLGANIHGVRVFGACGHGRSGPSFHLMYMGALARFSGADDPVDVSSGSRPRRAGDHADLMVVSCLCCSGPR